MLRAESEKQLDGVKKIMSELSIIELNESGMYLDDFITFDQMAMIVDYLRAKKT